jgi:hypothetical protein
MCGRSENVRKCLSKLGICGRFPRCFNHSTTKTAVRHLPGIIRQKKCGREFFLPVTLFGHDVCQSGFAQKQSVFWRFMRQSVKAGVREGLRGRLRSGMRAQYQKQ